MRVGEIASRLKELPQNAEMTVTVGGKKVEGAWSITTGGGTAVLAFDGAKVNVRKVPRVEPNPADDVRVNRYEGDDA